MTKTLISIAILLGLLPFFGCQQKEEKLTEAQLDEIAEKYGQFAPDDAWEGDTGFAYYGSENEFSRRQFTEVSAERLYKRRGQRQILKIIDGDVDDVMSLGDLKAKWEAFGWQVLEMEGNDMANVVSSLKLAKALCGKGKPILILMKTEMGQGVDFMMGSHKWHGVAPNDEQLAQALEQLNETLGDY